MRNDQRTVHALYKKLLTLYPRAFREKMGESMEQTFNDLYTQRKRKTEYRLFGYVLWIFFETAVGIIKEQALALRRRSTMKNIKSTFVYAALISFILMLPFAVLEAVNNNITRQNAPGLILLFGVLWLLPAAFIVILVPIVQKIRAGNSLLASPVNLTLRIAVLVVIALTWGWGFMDQLPCFLGVPNCD